MGLSSLLVFAAMAVPALEPVQVSIGADFGRSDVAEIEQTFSNYNKTLVDKKYEELPRYVQVPFIVIDGTSRIITDIGAVVAGLRSNRESLDDKGYATSIPAKARISVLSSDRVLVNRIVRHNKKDGALLETRANFYLMTKVSGTWRISGII
jgi:hypothetical protein